MVEKTITKNFIYSKQYKNITKEWLKKMVTKNDFAIHKVFTQSGRSIAVVIPSKFAEKLGITDGCYVRVFLKENCLVIEPLRQIAQEA